MLIVFLPRYGGRPELGDNKNEKDDTKGKSERDSKKRFFPSQEAKRRDEPAPDVAVDRLHVNVQERFQVLGFKKLGDRHDRVAVCTPAWYSRISHRCCSVT